MRLARTLHESSSPNRGDGYAKGRPQGLVLEEYVSLTLPGTRPEDPRKDIHIPE